MGYDSEKQLVKNIYDYGSGWLLHLEKECPLKDAGGRLNNAAVRLMEFLEPKVHTGELTIEWLTLTMNTNTLVAGVVSFSPP
jgi:hypothetical protein